MWGCSQHKGAGSRKQVELEVSKPGEENGAIRNSGGRHKPPWGQTQELYIHQVAKFKQNKNNRFSKKTQKENPPSYYFGAILHTDKWSSIFKKSAVFYIFLYNRAWSKRMTQPLFKQFG